MGKEVGTFEKKTLVEEIEIEWKITNFSSLLEDAYFKSPVFCLGNGSWYLEMLPRCTTEKFMRLYLCSDTVREYPVAYTFGLQKGDGSVEQLMKGILQAHQRSQSSSVAEFLEKTEVHQRKSELVPSDILTIIGRLKRETASRTQPSPVLDKRKLENLIKLDTLSENFKDLMANKDSCDATLHVKNKEYKAHRAVLIARSSVFAAMFLHETSEKQTGIVTIPDCDCESFEEFLKFLYCGKLENPSPHCALHLYETADKYNVQELKKFCAEYLMENLSVENFCDVVILADQYEESNLMSAAQGIFNNNLSKILQTSEWDCLAKSNYRLSKKLFIELSLKIKIVD